MRAVDLRSVTPETFEGLVGDTFTCAAGETTIELSLDECTAGVAPAGGASRTPFSLVFGGPAEPLLGQGIRRLEHARLGAFEIFLVPIAADAGARYEAVFA